MKKKIQNVVFDFGGVLLKIDTKRTAAAMKDLIGVDLMQLSPDHPTATYLTRFEKGEISTETFLNHFQRMASHPVEPKSIIDAWNTMLIGWQRDTLQNLEELKKKYNVFLLSNINELHLAWIQNDLKKKHHIQDFESRFFDHVYYSHLIGMRKPDSNIFHHIQNDAKLDAHSTLYFDDLAENVNIAKKEVGWQSILHPTNEDVFQTIHQYLT